MTIEELSDWLEKNKKNFPQVTQLLAYGVIEGLCNVEINGNDLLREGIEKVINSFVKTGTLTTEDRAYERINLMFDRILSLMRG